MSERPENAASPAAARAADGDDDWLAPLLERPRLSPGRVALAVGSLALVAALLGVGLPWATGTTWAQIIASLRGVPFWAAPLMLLLGVLVIVAESLTVSAAAPGAGPARCLHAHAASTALGLAVPGGGLLGSGLLGWLLHRAGLAVPAIVLAIVLASGVETVSSFVLMPIVALGSYAAAALTGAAAVELPSGTWAAVCAVAAGLLGLGTLAALLNRRLLSSVLDMAQSVGMLRGGRESALAQRDLILSTRDAMVDLLRTRPAALFGPMLLARLLQFLAFWIALRVIGAPVPLLLAIAVFALSRVLALVPVTPGGAGVTETVGAAALTALAVPAASAATAMLLLALTTLVAPLLAGAAAGATVPPRRPLRAASSPSSS